VETAARGWQEGTLAAFAICAEGEVVGGIGLRIEDAAHGVAEIGYWIARAARGRGLATRALRLVAAWALDDVRADRVQLRTELQNRTSQRVAEKADFVREGVLRSYRFNQRLGRRMDFVFYSLLPGDRR
jgi:RimJ/RimL family protein N-acetyltransferase